MELAYYPRIGQKANFIRINPKTKELEEGQAVILAICLDPQKRLMAHMQGTKMPDGNTDNFNIDLNCLSPSDDFKAKFKTVTDTVLRLSREGNGKVADLVAQCNEAVEDAYSSVLGEPLVLEQ